MAAPTVLLASLAALLAVLVTLPPHASALCPVMAGNGGLGGGGGELPAGHPRVPMPLPGYEEALAKLDLEAVRRDLVALFKTSSPEWPSDYHNYAPFFVRLAWHCSGSYRHSDGRGGCAGGRQRFDPERSWADNTNLNRARGLLWPIKEKYGLALSWGDLFILAGTTAVQSMGGPILGFCAGRVDDNDGFWSEELGPTPQQQEDAPCPVNGQCKPPLGSTTIGLIYLNPEGPMGKPLPAESAKEVRDSFGRMSMNDTETVALIGGGHAFGKTHGACPKGAGPSPKEDPFNPWPGECGTGRGADAFTSGFEGPWTSDPTVWDNTYFRQLVDYEWGVHKGPGGHYQWRVVNATSPSAPGPQGGARQDVMMLTTDVSLLHDPSYRAIVERFARDQGAFDHAFKHAWYKLTTRDMGPRARCTGPDVPPAQPWQNPLPPPPERLANFTAVATEVRALLGRSDPAFPADRLPPLDRPDYGPLMVRLASQCFSTFRVTDWLGGCNGARIRFPPERDWPDNKALDRALLLLRPVKERYGDALSWADLIVLTGTVALERAGASELPFCGGRTDAADGAGSAFLAPAVSGSRNDTVYRIKQTALLMGLSPREFTALVGGGHSLGQMHPSRSGYAGAWTADPSRLDNSFFRTLFAETWEPFTVPSTGRQQYRAGGGKELYMLHTDLFFRFDPELAAAAHDFASDNALFLREFSAAWTKMVNADRFDGPTGNLCHHHH